MSTQEEVKEANDLIPRPKVTLEHSLIEEIQWYNDEINYANELIAFHSQKMDGATTRRSGFEEKRRVAMNKLRESLHEKL